jgi:sugar lactone lactonase YvrE
MTHRNPIRTLLIVGLLATCGGVFPAGASLSPAELCAASQLTAVGKLASASLACHAATAMTFYPPSPCLRAAMTAFDRAWAAAEAKGGCVTTVQVQDVQAEVANVVAAAVGELTGTPEDALLTTPAARACAASKLKATANDAKALFACDTTGVKQGTLFSAACVNKTGGALVTAWDAAEAQGGCATVGDSEALPFDGLSEWGVTHLGPTPTPVTLTCGTFLTRWGKAGSGDGQFNTIISLAVDGSGNVFVADLYNNRVQKFDNNGLFLTTWGSAGGGDGQFYGPWGIAVDGSGNVFVADTDDYYNARIEKFDNTGKFLATWGSYGTGDGQFYAPEGVAVDASGNVFVADSGNDRIEKFDNTGKFLATWGGPGTGDGQFDASWGPYGVAVDGSGNVFVADAGNQRIEKFDNTGKFLATWGSYGTGDGQFNYPSGVAVDGSGNVFVVDGDTNRVQVFDNTGTFLTKWGTGSDGPNAVAVDGSGNVFGADGIDDHIQKFACPIPPPPAECGVVNGDPAAGTATCGGPCPPETPVCAWVPGTRTGTGTGACRCEPLGVHIGT